MKTYHALITLETTSPLYLNAGDHHVLYDNILIRDHHGLPCIYGTQIIGALSELFASYFPEHHCALFGQASGDKQVASLLVPSDSVMRDSTHTLVDLYRPHSEIQADFLLANLLEDAPVLIDRVQLNKFGVVANKYEYIVIPSGCRFSFTLELTDHDDEYSDAWAQLLGLIAHPLFRLGSATHQGFGVLKPIYAHCHQFAFNMTNSDHRRALRRWDGHPSTFPIAFIDDHRADDEHRADQASFDWQGTNHKASWANSSWSLTKDYRAEAGLHFGASNQLLTKWQPQNEQAHSAIKADREHQLKTVERLPHITWQPDNGNTLRAQVDIVTVIPTTGIKGAVCKQAIYLANSLFHDKQHGVHAALRKILGYVDESNNKSQASVLNWLVSHTLVSTIGERMHNKIDRLTSGVMAGGLFAEEFTFQDSFQLTIDIDAHRLMQLWKDYLKTHPSTSSQALSMAFALLDRALTDLDTQLLKVGGLQAAGYGTVAPSSAAAATSSNHSHMHTWCDDFLEKEFNDAL